MAKQYKVLGQSSPTLNTNTDVYTVPSATQTVISTITICNRDSSTATYRVAVRPSGETIADKHYIAYGASIPATDTIALTLGITLSEADVVTVYSSTSNISFNVFGSEIS